MPQSDTAAPAWPDEVVETVARIVERAYADGSNAGGRSVASDIFAAIAPHVAAEVAAAERRGIEQCADAIQCGCDPKQRAAAADTHPNGGARWMACGEANCGAIEAAYLRALPPSDPSGASALAEATRRAVEAERAEYHEDLADLVESTLKAASTKMLRNMPASQAREDAVDTLWIVAETIAAAIRQRGAGGEG